MSKESILFIYNADSSAIAQAIDFFHKIAGPATYQCKLCKITYGSLKMKPEWKQFVEGLPLKIRFLHKDEFEKSYKDFKTAYPAALREREGNLEEFISMNEMNGFHDLDQLIQAVKEKLQ